MANDEAPPLYYYLSVKTKNVLSEIGINGAPLIKDLEGDGVITTEPVSTWLLHGNNNLTIKIKPLDEENKNLSPTVEIILFLHDSASTVPKPKVIYAKYNYPDKENNKEKEIKLPVSESISFDFPSEIGTKLWNEAETLKNISENDKNEIVELINNLENSLINKDISSAINLQEYKILDDSIAEKKSVERLEDATKKGYEWLNQQTGVVAKKLTLDTTKFIICCKQMVVYIARKTGEDAILLESDDLYFDIPVYVSKIKNRWTIVR